MLKFLQKLLRGSNSTSGQESTPDPALNRLEQAFDDAGDHFKGLGQTAFGGLGTNFPDLGETAADAFERGFNSVPRGGQAGYSSKPLKRTP